MKELMLLIPLGGALLLTGCAGTETEFQCNDDVGYLYDDGAGK